MKYLLVSEDDARSLSARVTELLTEGWMLYGSPIVTPYTYTLDGPSDHTDYTQALVKGTADELQKAPVPFTVRLPQD